MNTTRWGGHIVRIARAPRHTARATAAALSLLLLLVLVPGVPAQALDLECVSLQGKLVDPYGNPVANRFVELGQGARRCSDDPPWETSTNADGTFVLWGKRGATPTAKIPVRAPGDARFTDLNSSVTPNLTTATVPDSQVPPENTLTLFYRITRVATSAPNIQSGATVDLSVTVGLPVAGTTINRVVLELPDHTQVDMTAGTADAKARRWDASHTTSATLADGRYTYWVCVPRATYTGLCSTATQSDTVARGVGTDPRYTGTFTVDNTAPTVDVNSFVPADGSTTANLSQRLSVQVTETLSGLSTSASNIVLRDVTAGTTKTISGFNLTYSAKTLETNVQTLIDGHLYHLSGKAVDLAGNETAFSMRAVEEGGGFLVATHSPQPADASIDMTDCTLSEPALGATTRKATCTNVPLDLAATTITLGGSRQVGTGFVAHAIPLGALKATTLHQRTLAQNAYATVPAPRSQFTRFTVAEPFQGPQSFPIPAFEGVLPGGAITIDVPAVWTDAQIFLDSTPTTPSTEKCANASASAALACMPDPVLSRYRFSLDDATTLSATADAMVAGTSCTIESLISNSFIAVCPYTDALKLAADSRTHDSSRMLPDVPTVPNPLFDTTFEQLIQDQAAAAGARFGGATWETDNLVTFRLTDSNVPAPLQGRPEVRIEQVQFSIDTLDAAMEAVANRLNPLLAPGVEPGTGGVWPWDATVDVRLNKVLLSVDPAHAVRDADIRNALAAELAAGTVVLAYKPVLPAHPMHSMDCADRHHCVGPIRAGVSIDAHDNRLAGMCTMGFTMVDHRNIRYMSTAGHCAGSPWKHHERPVGSTVFTQRSGKVDFKVVRENNEDLDVPHNYLFRPGNRATRVTMKIIEPSATIGNYVCHQGRHSGQQCGRIEEYNSSALGVHGQGRYTAWICGGDSGGPVANMYNDRAYGILSTARTPRGTLVASGHGDDCHRNVPIHFGWVPEFEKASGYRVLLDEVTDTLGPGQQLLCSDYIRSNNGQFTLVMQCDGNLVGYETSAFGNIPFWSTNTFGDLHWATMKNDGFFVVYEGNWGAWDPAIVWTGGCNPCEQGSYLVMQNDRNIVVYRPGGSIAWQSGTGR